jgi:hypothetical protein
MSYFDEDFLYNLAKNERHLKLKDAKIHTRFIKIGIGGNVLEKENMVAK